MDRRRRYLEVPLHVGLGGRASMDPGVGVNEGQILALLGGEIDLQRGVTGIGHLIHPGFQLQ